MKYMGSKRYMLENGLSKLLFEQAKRKSRFVDLFTGAAYVSWFIAQKTNLPVLAIDLQKYATTQAASVICRTHPLNAQKIYNEWIELSIERRNNDPLWKQAQKLKMKNSNIEVYVNESRELCTIDSQIGPVWNAYGGHYFSPEQALTFDFLLQNLPSNKEKKIVCLASCISAASECAASPGHTAQPFQPTKSAGKYILESWIKNPIDCCKKYLENICPRYANTKGFIYTGDANSILNKLTNQDLVFIDPPYSNVQYSRFYHVLETVANGKKQSVEGAGRYPPISERPQSKFSNPSQAKEALSNLLEGIYNQGCNIILTFPSGESSNGLSGDYIKNLSSKWFILNEINTVEGKFSTLGGNNSNRNARNKSHELILLLIPKEN